MVKPKILFVDDDNFLRKVYESELKDKGFDVYLAVDGEDGWDKVFELAPDLIILDLIMPKKSGFELLTDLQNHEEAKHIPVIVLSNLAQSDDQERALGLGAADYLVKDNTTLDVIAEKINYHLRRTADTRPKGPLTKKAVSEYITRAGGPAGDTPPTAQKQEAPTPGVPHNFCARCGAHLEKAYKFCPKCGAAQSL